MLAKKVSKWDLQRLIPLWCLTSGVRIRVVTKRGNAANGLKCGMIDLDDPLYRIALYHIETPNQTLLEHRLCFLSKRFEEITLGIGGRKSWSGQKCHTISVPLSLCRLGVGDLVLCEMYKTHSKFSNMRHYFELQRFQEVLPISCSRTLKLFVVGLEYLAKPLTRYYHYF